MLQKLAVSWAALGISLSSATQIRAEAAPVGPGEAVLVGWILFVGFLLLRGLRFTSSQVFPVLAAYWMASAALLGLGALMAVRIGIQISLRDAFAYCFVAVYSCLLGLQLGQDREDYHARLAFLTFFAVTIVAAALLMLAMVLPGIGPIDFWWGPRFRGWAENPNQMALFMIGMPFLGWYLLRRRWSSRRFWRQAIAYGFGIACCVWVGLATGSDSLRVAWALTLGGIGALVWYRTVLRSRGAVMYVSHVVTPLVLIGVAYAYGPELVLRVERVAQATYEEGDQGADRLTLWWNGVEAISHSPFVGLGPGSHSGVRRPFERAEAHNSLIDWGMSTGTLGVALHLGLLIWAGLRAIRANSFALLGLVTALAVFSLFGYTFRQPVYWLMIVLVLTLAERRPAVLRERPHAPPGISSGAASESSPTSLAQAKGKLFLHRPCCRPDLSPSSNWGRLEIEHRPSREHALGHACSRAHTAHASLRASVTFVVQTLEAIAPHLHAARGNQRLILALPANCSVRAWTAPGLRYLPCRDIALVIAQDGLRPYEVNATKTKPSGYMLL